ncbi:MAG: hypothetical protein AAGN82_01865 [Myxococcota bacterium]
MPTRGRTLTLAVFILHAGFGAASCGRGVNAGEALRPEAPVATDAIAETVRCTGPRTYAEPLVVDWSTAGRTDLEVAMKSGVAVVHYDCEELRLINGCRLPARYAFAGVSLKEELHRMDNADEVQARFPVSGVTLSAGVDRASVLDLALMVIGKQSTTLAAADPGMLEGSCEGATHFVRAATLGAFAMDRSSSGRARAAADVFGFGAAGSSASERSHVTRDGNPKACQKGRVDGAEAPPDCSAALRLELIPLTPAETPSVSERAAPKRAPMALPDPRVTSTKECPVDAIWREDTCVTATPRERLCARGNVPACQALCDGGDGWGCASMGEAWGRRLMSPGRSAESSDTLLSPDTLVSRMHGAFAKGCALRHDGSCAAWLGLRKKAPTERARSRWTTATEATCRAGGAHSCAALSELYRPDAKVGDRHPGLPVSPDREKFTALKQRSCDLGHLHACVDLATFLQKRGDSETRALGLLMRTCEGGLAYACSEWRQMLELRGRPVEVARALALECLHGDLGFVCAKAARLFHASTEVPRDPDRALQLARRGCKLRREESCVFLHEQGTAEDRSRASSRLCDPSEERPLRSSFCAPAAADHLRQAAELDGMACRDGDAPACERQATRLLAKACAATFACGNLRARDAAAYREVVERKCSEEEELIRTGRFIPPETERNAGVGRWCRRAADEGLRPQ